MKPNVRSAWSSLIIMCLSLLGSCPALGDAAPAAKMTEAARGADLFRRGEWAAAVEAFDKAIAQNPKDASSYLWRGGGKLKLGDKEGAKADFAMAFKLDPELAKEAVSPPKDPIEEFNQAIERNPRERKAYVGRGWARAERGDTKGAEQDFTTAIELDPEIAEAYLDRGRARAVLGDAAGAIADFDQVIQLEPKNAEAYNLRGTVKGMRADWSAAITDLRKAIELDARLKAEVDPLIEECERGLAAAGQKAKEK